MQCCTFSKIRTTLTDNERPVLYTDAMFERNNLHDLPYPIKPSDVSNYEDLLQTNINVFSFFDDEGKARYPMFISRKIYARWANLLYWNKHYAPIKNIDRLFSNITKHHPRKNICFRCFGHFTTPEILERHKLLCSRDYFMSVLHVLPRLNSEEAHIKFCEFRNTSRAPFVIYADFESILEPMDVQNKRTHYEQLHKVCAAAAILCSYIPEMNNKVMIYTGPNALEEFLNKLIQWEQECIDYLKQNIPMKSLNAIEERDYVRAINCYLCRKAFLGDDDPRGYKVRDHDHITGNFLGAEHRQCNIERSVKYLIPVFFHNFLGYDSHLIVHQFRFHKEHIIKVIGQNMEKYLQIQWGENIVFRDSLQFLFSSLDALSGSIAKSG